MMELSCPAPHVEDERIVMGHGSGGRLAHRLLEDIFYPAFSCPELDRHEDQALLTLPAGTPAFTTDSFVVSPLFFPGGDIGKLAVHGTVNDLAVGGARPLYLSAAFIIEEGFALATLRRVVDSMAQAARESGVSIVTGDTKVVDRGSADGLFVTTAGVGVVPPGRVLGAERVRPGDEILVSGTLADHGMAVMLARESLGLSSQISSDTASVSGLTESLFSNGVDVHCMRDPTRGGLAASLTEIASRAKVDLEIDEARIPVNSAVRGACELLGMDPMFVANEGKVVVFVAAGQGDRALQALRKHPLGVHGVRVGRVTGESSGSSVLLVRTAIGGSRRLELPLWDPLPRIC